jgi:murein DD-endopeptidase MepM/ murein hydrolase activator NlpD
MRWLPLLLLPSIASAQLPAGGGPAPIEIRDDISAAHRARIDAMLQRNAAELERAGTLAPASPPMPLQSGLQWPLRAAPGVAADPGYHGISNFVDLDPAYPNHLLDWNCGTRTYDLASGQNHAGIDIFLWPFPWLKMDQQAVDIVAAAPGTIIGKTDGNDDRSCPNHYSADWNAVYVRHADGSVAWYGHMKKSSLTAKAIGASVATGEFLGKVGSAGFSTGPHLHFENHSAVSNYTILEPFHGACNAPASLWRSSGRTTTRRSTSSPRIGRRHRFPARIAPIRSTKRPTTWITSPPETGSISPPTTATSSPRRRPSRCCGRTAASSRRGRIACRTRPAIRTTPRRIGTGRTCCPPARPPAPGDCARSTRARPTRTISTSAT